jgi:hypothetical protein
MSWLGRNLRDPATESQSRLILALCVIALSVMCILVIWQSQVIANQRDTIR